MRRGRSPLLEPRGHAAWAREHQPGLHASSRHADPPEGLASLEHGPTFGLTVGTSEEIIGPLCKRSAVIPSFGIVRRRTIASGVSCGWLLSARVSMVLVSGCQRDSGIARSDPAHARPPMWCEAHLRENVTAATLRPSNDEFAALNGGLDHPSSSEESCWSCYHRSAVLVRPSL